MGFSRGSRHEAVATLVNTIWSEPVTGDQLRQDEAKIPPGQLHHDEEGLLKGWDRPKWVAEDTSGEVVGYAMPWRAPWTEPGTLYLVFVVHPEKRGRGVGSALYSTMLDWATKVKASRLVADMREGDEESLAYAKRRGYVMERHIFESVLDLATFDPESLSVSIPRAEQSGIRFLRLVDEPGEESERKLYELYELTHRDIPGYSDSFPPFGEWKKLYIGQPRVKPEWIIAKDGERYIGVVTLQHHEENNAMYHEYTGVHPDYRGRRVGLALKLLAFENARSQGIDYLRTLNDSMNAPMLRINRDPMGFRAEPGLYKMVREL